MKTNCTCSYHQIIQLEHILKNNKLLWVIDWPMKQIKCSLETCYEEHENIIRDSFKVNTFLQGKYLVWTILYKP